MFLKKYLQKQAQFKKIKIYFFGEYTKMEEIGSDDLSLLLFLYLSPGTAKTLHSRKHPIRGISIVDSLICSLKILNKNPEIYISKYSHDVITRTAH